MQSKLSLYRRPVISADEAENIVSAAQKLGDAHVGCLVVTRAKRPIGILTDRDVAIRVVAEGRSLKDTCVRDVATYGPFTAHEDDTVSHAIAVMREHGIRRVPIVNAAGEISGIVTADDLMLELGRDMAELSRELEAPSDACDSR